MLSQAIGDLLPSAVVVALSPVPIIAVILMLATPRARSNGVAFMIGWIAGLVAVSVVVLFLFSGADDPDSASADSANWGKVAIGVLFFSMAAKQWRKRPKKGEPPEMPGWIDTVSSFHAGKSLVLGAALSGVNPKNLALTAAAAASIAQAGLSTGDEAIAIAVFVAIGSVTVVGAVLFYLVAPRAAERPLTAVREFMADHNAVIMMVVLIVIGAKLLGNGISGLTA
jgi:threonine/homoserine/homoserine lactone efflux protein